LIDLLRLRIDVVNGKARFGLVNYLAYRADESQRIAGSAQLKDHLT
jgi:hypothetical protein